MTSLIETWYTEWKIVAQTKHRSFSEDCQNWYHDNTRQTQNNQNCVMTIPWWHWYCIGNDTWCIVNTKTDTKFVRYFLELVTIVWYWWLLPGITRYFQVLPDIVSYCHVSPGIASYCQILPVIAPTEEKRNIIQIVLFMSFFSIM